MSINTNEGLIKSHQKCDILYINYVWYNKNYSKIITSIKDMTEKFRVLMDSREELKLIVHIPNNIVKFKQFSNGLYVIDPNDEKSFVLTNKEYQ